MGCAEHGEFFGGGVVRDCWGGGSSGESFIFGGR